MPFQIRLQSLESLEVAVQTPFYPDIADVQALIHRRSFSEPCWMTRQHSAGGCAVVDVGASDH
jgi:hypothetical protein